MKIEVRTLREDELDAADGICRRSYGTHLSLSDPLSSGGDAEVLRSRWAADPEAVLAVLEDGVLAGTAVVTRWGSVGLFGPLGVEPSRQGRGLGRALAEEAIRLLDEPGVRFRGALALPESARSVGLLLELGYWPAGVVAFMSRKVSRRAAAPEGSMLLSSLDDDGQVEALSGCRALTDELFDGLDVTGEVLAVGEHGLGETVLLGAGGRIEAFAVCHAGAGSEAGSGRALVRVAAVRPGPGGRERLATLLDAVEVWAAYAGARVLTAGTGSGRVVAWETLRAAGFRLEQQRLAMHRDRQAGYDGEDVLVLDDWR